MTKIEELYKQFGFFYIIKSFIKRIVSPFVKQSSFYILAIENHCPSALPLEVEQIDSENMDTFLKNYKRCSIDFKRQLKTFLLDKTIAIVVKKKGQVAGWGFVKQEGISKYGGYNYHIPKTTHLLKNLFVDPEFRGQSIGKIINESRINAIPKGITPTVFVLPSNKYAIRNLEMYGFIKQINVKDTLWFNTIHKRKVKKLKENSIVNTIEKGFKNGE